MKRLVSLSTLLVVLLSACGASAPSTPTVAAPASNDASLPVIAVDAEHMITPTLSYDIPAGPGFVLDASTYMFGTASGPTLIQVIVDGREYQGHWTATDNIQIVRAESLLPPAGFKALTAFPAGKQLIIAIGMTSEAGRFEPLWVASVNVY